MKLLNLCCGAVRPGGPWTNLDTLRQHLKSGTPERTNLDAETNYVDHDVLSGALPFLRNAFDGILASHCVEHWDCQESVRVLRECNRVLVRGGIITVSVPDAEYFRDVTENDTDTPENSERLFGEPIFPGDGESTFFGYGLFNRFHKQILTRDAVWCLLERAGFNHGPSVAYEVENELLSLVNRRKFSLIMEGTKP